jgi:hypothetical protein
MTSCYHPMLLTILSTFLLAQLLPSILAIGQGYSLVSPAGPGVARSAHNYLSKYGIPLNLR